MSSIKRIRAKAFSSALLRNAATISAGAALGQLIAIAFTPIITRLYGPSTYGVLSLYTSYTSMLASVATLCYAHALVLPKERKRANALLILGFSIVIILAGTLVVGIGVFGDRLANWVGAPELDPFKWVLPISLVALGSVQILDNLNIRLRNFRAIAFAGVIQATVAGLLRVGGAFLGPSAAILIIAGVIAQLLQGVVLLVSSWRGALASASTSVGAMSGRWVLSVAQEYSDFPKFRAPQVLLNMVSRALPVILLGAAYGTSTAAFFSLAQAILYVPVVIVSQSVGKVLLERMAALKSGGEPILPPVKYGTAALVLIGLLPFGLVVAGGPIMFKFVFGADWATAGTFARWLSPWVFFHFVNIPAVQSLVVSGNQDYLLRWEVVTTLAKIAVLSIFISASASAEYCVIAYAGVGAIAYVFLIIRGIEAARPSR